MVYRVAYVKTLIKPCKGLKTRHIPKNTHPSGASENANKTLQGIKTTT